LQKHNTQYPKIELKVFKKSHDRFLIIDNKTIYHIGASLKDLGKKWFAFSKINIDAKEMIDKLHEMNYPVAIRIIITKPIRQIRAIQPALLAL